MTILLSNINDIVLCKSVCTSLKKTDRPRFFDALTGRGYPCETPNPVKRRIYPNFQKTPLFISTMNNSLNSTPMKLAIADLELQNKSNILATAKKYNVVESIFRRRWKDQSVFHEKTFDIYKQRLSSIEKKALITQINQLTNRELSSINRIVRNLIEEMIQSSMKKNWTKNFCRKHENKLKSIYLRNIDSKRVKIEYAFLFQRFYQLIKAFFQWFEF